MVRRSSFLSAFAAILVVAFCLSSPTALADQTSFVSPAKWAMDHNLDPTMDMLNAIQRGADLAFATGGDDPGPLLDLCILRKVEELRDKTSPKGGTHSPLGRTADSHLVKHATTQATLRLDFLSPSNAVPGTLISVIGMSFKPGATVTFGGVPATTVFYSSCVVLGAVVPPGSGTVDVVVTNPDFTTTAPTSFTYASPASPSSIVVSYLFPDVGPTAGGGTVTIHGSGFAAGNSVFFTNAITGESLQVPAPSVNVVDPNTIQVPAPPGAAGPTNVRVSGAGGTTTLNNAYFYTGAALPSPIVSSFDTAAAPGATINIFGTNFVGVQSVLFSTKSSNYSYSTVGATPTVLSSTHMTAVVPAGAVSGPIQVNTISGTFSPCTIFSVLTSGPPTITTLPATTPTQIPSQSYGTFIDGTNFQNVQEVLVNGLPVAFFLVESSTIMEISLGYLHPAGPVTVKTPGGVVTTVASLNVVEPEYCQGPVPTITGVTSPAAPNSSVSITGTNFDPENFTKAVGVRFAGERALVPNFVSNNSTPITSTVPGGDPGPSPVGVVTDFGSAIGGSLTPTVLAAPSISGLSVASGVRGAAVTVNGTNLNGAYEVAVGGEAVSLRGTSITPTGFTFVVPWPILTGPLPVVVNAAAGSASTTFTASCIGPVITSYPASGRVGSLVTLNGTGFIRSPGRTLVFFNGVRASAISANSDTSMTVTVPRGATTGSINMITGNATSSTGTFTVLGNADTEFSGDGKSDILWHNTSNGQNYIYRMDGLTIVSQDFVNAVPDPAWQIVGTGDFNGDGLTDILWRNSTTGDNYVYLMNGSTITSSGVINTIADSNWRVAGVGDFDGNGRDDILWRNISTGTNYIYFMNGLVITSQVFVNTVPTTWQVAGIGDLDGDGRSDIIWRNSATGENYAYLMIGATIAGYGTINTIADANWQVAGVGDFNNDQKADILWHNNATGANYIYYMAGTFILQQDFVNTVPDTNWHIVATGDFNRDGITDILWRNSATGQNYVYLMNGSAIGANGTINVVSDPAWHVYH